MALNMRKTNWSKAEDSFAKGLHKLEVEQLLQLADEASGKKQKKKHEELSPNQMMILVNIELNRLKENDPKLIKELNIDKKELKKLTVLAAEDPKRLKPEDIEKMKGWLQALGALKSRRSKELPSEKEMIEERKRHVYKRHEKRDKWLPLDTHSDFKGLKS